MFGWGSGSHVETPSHSGVSAQLKGNPIGRESWAVSRWVPAPDLLLATPGSQVDPRPADARQNTAQLFRQHHWPAFPRRSGRTLSTPRAQL